MQKPKFNINQILQSAEDENEKLRLTKYPVETPPDGEKSEEPKRRDDENIISGAKDPSEADAIINKYSQKSRLLLDEKTSSDALRQTLNGYMANDKELFNYYRNFESRKKSRRVEELYNLISFATQSDLEEKEALLEKGGKDFRQNHFTETQRRGEEVRGKQQKFIDYSETSDIYIPEPQGIIPEYDEEYDNLSEKIENGAIDFTEEGEDGQVPMIDDTPPVRSPKSELDSKDRNLRLVFDMLEGDLPETEKAAAGKKSYKKQKLPPVTPAYEYVSRGQNSEIQEMLTKAIRASLARFIIALIIGFGILYIELASPGSSFYSPYLRPGRYGVIYTLVDLQLLFFFAITLLDSVKRGAANLFRGKANSESLLFVSFLVSASHCLVTVFIDGEVSLGLYCLPTAALGAGMAFVRYLQCRKDYHCFKIVASTRSKYVAEKLTGRTKEAEEFYKYMFEESTIYTTRKTDFVEGFFRRLHTPPESESVNGFIIALSFVASVCLMGLVMYEGSAFYESFTIYTKAMAFSLPISSFFIISLPVIAANRIGKKNGSAFIGNAVGEEYADASVISFADTEVYPSNLVKITSIKVYGNYRIDKIIHDLIQVFSFVGGPLKAVTGSMMTRGVEPPQNPKLIESASDGICVVIDGREMFLGKRNYLRRYRFEAPYDESDLAFERRNGSVMYVTLNDSLIAKVYIRYTLNPQFNSLLRDLYKAGMCVGIKTTDPNITNALVEQAVKYKKTPISILKAGDVRDVEGENEKTDSGIVVNASLHTFLKMFIVCDKIRHVTKANGIISVLSLAIAFFVSFFLAFTGQMLSLPSWYPVLYQLIWLAPVGIVSFLL
ncbi:MAG: hypothetical protein WC143_01330 [Eubacteriales bacterium]